MKVQIKATATEAIIAALQKTTDDLARKHLSAAIREGAKIIQVETVRLAPEATGELKGDIKVRKERTPGDAPVAYAVGTRKVFYAHFLEFGTRKMRPRPFLRPALDSKREEAQQKILEVLRKRMKIK